MKRFILFLAVLAVVFLPMGTAQAGKTSTLRFDSLPTGLLEPGPHIIGNYVVQRIGFGDTMEVVELGDGRKGLVDSNPENGASAGVSILPLQPRTCLRVRSFTARTDGGWVKIMGQWTEPYELFYPTAAPWETLTPTFAGTDVAFLNLAIWGQGDDHVIESVDLEASSAVDPAFLSWTTAAKNRMKVRSFGTDRWFSEGLFETEGFGDWRIDERDGEGDTMSCSGTFSRASKRAFLLTLDAGAAEEFEILCAKRFAAKTGVKAQFSVTSAVGKSRYNRTRTRVSVRLVIRGVVTGEFGTKPFCLKTRSRGILAK